MSDRQKLPRYIVVLNIAMIVILLAICALIFALTLSSKELGWALPTADSQSSSVSQTADEAASSAQASDTE